MVRPFANAEAADKARAWQVLLHPSMSDRLLGEAVKLVATGKVEIYGSCKPLDVNRAAQKIRRERIQEWKRTNGHPDGPRDPIDWLAYTKGFYAAIGNGCNTTVADQHGRAAVAHAKQLTQDGHTAKAAINTIEQDLTRGEIPWKTTPPPREPRQILPPSGQQRSPTQLLAEIRQLAGTPAQQPQPRTSSESPGLF